jgi:hypothetical protein
MLAAAIAPLGAGRVEAAGGDSLVSVVNRYRSNAGLGPVAMHGTLDALAVERSNEVAAAQVLGHDFEALKVRFAQTGVCWEAFGEIVLRNSRLDYEAFILQWYNSPTHNAQMLGTSYTHAGGSWTQGADGRYYAVMIFVKLCGSSPAPSQPSSTFWDTAGSPFLADIEWLAASGISNGCGGGAFCPASPVSREQMASFLRRALNLPAAGADYFWDDAGSAHQDDINRVAQAGIANGCGGGAFCPGSVVSREQMASFLARALGLPAPSGDYFWDDSGSIHEDAINRLAEAGITTGCAAGQYCPGSGVTREQMAAFLHRAFD